jgi:hypothetical protein
MPLIPGYLKLWIVTGVYFHMALRSTPHTTLHMTFHMTLHMYLCAKCIFTSYNG